MSLVKEDTSSLLMNGDTDSIRSNSTRNSKLVDVVFDFDREIFNSNAYRGALRSNMMHIMSENVTVGQLPLELVPDSLTSNFDFGFDEDDQGDIFISVETETHTVTSPLLETETDLTKIEEENRSITNDPVTINKHEVHQESKAKQAFRRFASGDFIQNTKTQPSSTTKRGNSKADRRSWLVQKRKTPPRIELSSAAPIADLEKLVHRMDLEGREKLSQKILLLGTGSSGKTTLLKSMQMLWPTGGPESCFSHSEWQDNIKASLLQDVCLIMKAMESNELRYENFGENDRKKLPAFEEWNWPDVPYYTPEMVEAIEKLWKDPGVQKAWSQSGEFLREADPHGHTA